MNDFIISNLVFT